MLYIKKIFPLKYTKLMPSQAVSSLDEWPSATQFAALLENQFRQPPTWCTQREGLMSKDMDEWKMQLHFQMITIPQIKCILFKYRKGGKSFTWLQ